MIAYQEDLLSLEDLRRRMPELRKREKAIGSELNAIQSQLADRAWIPATGRDDHLRGYAQPRRPPFGAAMPRA